MSSCCVKEVRDVGNRMFLSIKRCIKAAYPDRMFVVFSFKGRTNLFKEDQFSVTKSAAPSSIGGKPRHESGCASESFWVGHCIINHEYTKELSDEVILKVVTMDLHQSASDFPDELLNGADHLGTLTVIHRSLPHR